MFYQENFTPMRFVSEGSININGSNIAYNTISEDNIFYDEKGNAIASIFSFSYFKKDVENKAQRPVIFAFNGGPGSSSVMLHIGLLGPKRIKYNSNLNDAKSLPPYEVIDNPECLIDIADIVLIDPINTGFGLLIDKDRENEFYGIREDAEAFVSFVQMWIQRYNRYQSPKYILAESYGCTRAAMAVEIASGQGFERCYDIAFNGLILIGNTITPGKYFNVDLPIEKAVLGFETYAALNWLYNTNHSISLDLWTQNAREFADTEYLIALNKGNRLSAEERSKIKEKIKYFTGVSDYYLEEKNLKLDSFSIKDEILRSKGLAISRLDGRVTRQLYSNQEYEDKFGLSIDGVRGKYNPIFISALVSELFPILGIQNFNRSYKPAVKISKKWNKECDISASECLSNTMKRRHTMRVFFANGYYDLTTESGVLYYMLSHTDLDKDRVIIKRYATGHMVYLGEDEIKTFTSDVRNFINSVKPEESMLLSEFI